MNYRDKLQDPRWERFRREVIEDANYRCAKCHRPEREIPLHVHHPFYRPKTAPWNYDISEVQCLCQDCHEKAHGLYVEDEDVPF